MKKGFKGVINSLKIMELNLDQKVGIKHEADSVGKKVNTSLLILNYASFMDFYIIGKIW